MKKHHFIAGLSLAALFLIIFNSSCGSGEKKEDIKDSIAIQQVKPFSLDNYKFAILENSSFIPYNKAIYHRGDKVYMVLENVGPFAFDSDSLNHAEMRIEVTNAIGELIYKQDSLFGPSGKRNFPNGIIKAPYAGYQSDDKNKPGKHTMTLVVYDLIKRDSIVISDDFFLE
jgi:hypothetical protein